MARNEYHELVEQARLAARGAYAPYSRFPVGAAVLGGSGRVYTGCNVENASYGLSVCAERVAVWKAISEGETGIMALALYGPTSEPLVPCGACLQVMSEFNPDMDLVMTGRGDRLSLATLKDLLKSPFVFEEGKGLMEGKAED